MIISSIKHRIFKIMHDYPIDVWIMWNILILAILAIIIKMYYNLTSESEIQQYIMRL
jgi:hypothetical protein